MNRSIWPEAGGHKKVRFAQPGTSVSVNEKGSPFGALVEQERKVCAGLVILRFAGPLEEERVEGAFEDGFVALYVEQTSLSQSEDRRHARLLLF